MSDFFIIPSRVDQFSLIATQVLLDTYDAYQKNKKNIQIGLVINEFVENSLSHKEYVSV